MEGMKQVGMFDTITHKMKCPKCNKNFGFQEQIKWTNNCFLIDYRVGDKINAADGEYDYATWVRPELIAECPHCKEKIPYKVIVKDGILTEIRIL